MGRYRPGVAADHRGFEDAERRRAVPALGMPSAADLVALRSHDLNQLAVLLVLLKARGVSAAARQLGISQPTLSKSLERLRRDFDDPLLVRVGNAMRLTPTAELLLPALEAALDQVSAVFSSVAPFDPARSRGRLRIAASDYVQIVFGARLLRRLRESAPLMTIEFRPVGIPDPERLLTDDLVDIAIGRSWPTQAVRQQRLYDDPFVCAVGRDNMRVPERLDIAGFCAQQHLDVSPTGTGVLRSFIDPALEALGGRRQVQTSASSFMAVPELVTGTGLVALVPSRVVGKFPHGSVRLVTLAFDLPPYAVALWWHNTRHADPLNRWARGQIIELAQSI